LDICPAFFQWLTTWILLFLCRTSAGPPSLLPSSICRLRALLAALLLSSPILSLLPTTGKNPFVFHIETTCSLFAPETIFVSFIIQLFSPELDHDEFQKILVHLLKILRYVDHLPQLPRDEVMESRKVNHHLLVHVVKGTHKNSKSWSLIAQRTNDGLQSPLSTVRSTALSITQLVFPPCFADSSCQFSVR